jgi:hypothetical protein
MCLFIYIAFHLTSSNFRWATFFNIFLYKCRNSKSVKIIKLKYIIMNMRPALIANVDCNKITVVFANPLSLSHSLLSRLCIFWSDLCSYMYQHKGHMATFQLYWWGKTSGAHPCIISDTRWLLSRTIDAT